MLNADIQASINVLFCAIDFVNFQKDLCLINVMRNNIPDNILKLI